MASILVTGGTGFIGTHFVNAAIERGHSVSVLSRTSKPTNGRLIVGQIDEIKEFDCEVIVHLAAHTANRPYDTHNRCLYWNAVAPATMVERAAASGIRRFIIVGSYFEYGTTCNEFDYVPPGAPLRPIGSYPTSKAAASLMFLSMAKELGLQLSIHRIAQVYGIGEVETRFWPSLCNAAVSGHDLKMTSGSQVRDFVPVARVVDQLIDALDLKIEDGRPSIENIGSGIARSLKQFAEDWWIRLRATGELRVGALPDRPDELLRCVPLVGERIVL